MIAIFSNRGKLPSCLTCSKFYTTKFTHAPRRADGRVWKLFIHRNRQRHNVRVNSTRLHLFDCHEACLRCSGHIVDISVHRISSYDCLSTKSFVKPSGKCYLLFIFFVNYSGRSNSMTFSFILPFAPLTAVSETRMVKRAISISSPLCASTIIFPKNTTSDKSLSSVNLIALSLMFGDPLQLEIPNLFIN